jgi:hypothetical protein
MLVDIKYPRADNQSHNMLIINNDLYPEVFAFWLVNINAHSK